MSQYQRNSIAAVTMEPWNNANTTLTFTVWLLLLLLNADDDRLHPALPEPELEEEDFRPPFPSDDNGLVIDTASLMRSILMNFRLCASLNVFHDEVDYWVKPRSTTWFSRFLLEQYDSSRWISMFRMTKPAVFALAEVIRPHVERRDTAYRLAVPVLVRVACTLFKLTHAANFTICSEMFAIGRSTVSKILREVVHAINDCLRQEISWPVGERMRETQRKFFDLCSLPAVCGAMDGVQFAISKPHFAGADYFYFKTGGYSMNCQAVVDSDKRFLDLYVGMPGSTNDSCMLRRSSLYQLATHSNFFQGAPSVDSFSPYLLADSGYPLLPWLMIPHKDGAQLSVAETLLNRKLRKGRSVVENAFGILKQSFRELLGKSELQLTFLPDVVVCCSILHNILLRQSHEEVEQFLQVLQDEGLEMDNNGDMPRPELGPPLHLEETGSTAAQEKRLRLGQYLATRRRALA